MFRSLPFVLCVCSCLTAQTVPAAAEPAVDTREVAVRHADLDLRTAAGVDALYVRLQHAAAKACRRGDDRLVSAARVRACRADAIDRAIAGFGHRELTKRHEVKAARAS